MYRCIRTLFGAAVMLGALAACSGAAPEETAPAVFTAVPLENQTAYPPPAAVPADQTAYPGQAPVVPNEVPSAYPGMTTTP